MNLAERLRQDVHLAILHLLEKCIGYSQNHMILRMAVGEVVGVELTETEIRARLDWLENNKLITTEQLTGGGLGDLVKATITRKGQLVARGEDVVTGVSRPAPGSF
jgi:hypothetical protein